MKRAVYLMPRALLLTLSVALAGCELGQMLQAERTDLLTSSGTVATGTPLDLAAVTANPNFLPDTEPDENSSKGDMSLDQLSRFSARFAQRFSSDFPGRLRVHGVKTVPPGRDVPLLRLRFTGYRVDCATSPCRTEVHLDGALLESDGVKTWSFSWWVRPEELERHYEDFCRDLLGLMVRDQVIPSG
jgi:hypothetical protein